MGVTPLKATWPPKVIFPIFGRVTAGKYVYPDSNETLKNMFHYSNNSYSEKFMEIFLIKPNCLLTMLI